jgi:hypothetical protein
MKSVTDCSRSSPAISRSQPAMIAAAILVAEGHDEVRLARHRDAGDVEGAGTSTNMLFLARVMF